MLEQQRARDAEKNAYESGAGIQDIIRYRRQAEELVGSDENLFRIDWVRMDSGLTLVQDFLSIHTL